MADVAQPKHEPEESPLSPWWIRSVLIVMVGGFAGLLAITELAYRNAPPIPGRDRFLAEMNTVVPWADLVAVIEPYYPKTTIAGGRLPVGLERMLRIHCLQLWFDLSDPAVEEALYDSRVEHSIGVNKRVFGFTKVRYRGLAKNGNRVFVTAALANIFLV